MKSATIRLLLAALLAMAASGCGSSTRRVEVSRSEVHPGEVERVETVERVEIDDDDDDGGGILSGAIDVLGDIIALPFRAVGALFRAIF